MSLWSWPVFSKCIALHTFTICNRNEFLKKTRGRFPIEFVRFMNDVKMMLGKRTAEYYFFVTWCIIFLILMLVSSASLWRWISQLNDLFLEIITFSKLFTAEALSNNAGGGFDAYVYPRWSTIVGWFIFVGCIISILLVFIINYMSVVRFPMVDKSRCASHCIRRWALLVCHLVFFFDLTYSESIHCVAMT